jgi:mono/diheme cytochrome c family protein
MLTFSDVFSEGGLIKQFKSAMPAWKSILTEAEIWQVIAFIRKLGAG